MGRRTRKLRHLGCRCKNPGGPGVIYARRAGIKDTKTVPRSSCSYSPERQAVRQSGDQRWFSEVSPSPRSRLFPKRHSRDPRGGWVRRALLETHFDALEQHRLRTRFQSCSRPQ